jgi:hypothetical protein
MPNILEFKQAYEAAFVQHRSRLQWAGDLQRTTYMQAFIYPTIGEILGMSFLYEYSNVDVVFFEKTLPLGVQSEEASPLKLRDEVSSIAVEHENDGRSIRNELQNFVASGLPLNVLVT